jgi:hypothetical protein
MVALQEADLGPCPMNGHGERHAIEKNAGTSIPGAWTPLSISDQHTVAVVTASLDSKQGHTFPVSTTSTDLEVSYIHT